jgi:hypothetical protein
MIFQIEFLGSILFSDYKYFEELRNRFPRPGQGLDKEVLNTCYCIDLSHISVVVASR